MENNPSPRSKELEVAYFRYPVSNTIPLHKPSVLPDIGFWEVLSNRKSERNFKGFSFVDLGNVLWISAKVSKMVIQPDGYVLTHRPSASAGARHPIDILVFHKRKGYDCYYYNPFEHSLNTLSFGKPLKEFINHVDSIVKLQNGIIIWFIAHPSRTEAKYHHPMSLVWRDAGALIHSIQIACAAFRFNSCPVGSLGEPFISELFKNYGEVFGVGGLIIG